MKFRTWLILLILSSQLAAGEYADAFLEGGITARAVAMANVLGCLDFSASAVLSNPAGLAYLSRPQIGLLYASQFGLANYNYLYGGLPISPRLKAGFSWVRLSVDDIPLRPDIVRQVPDKEARRDTLNILRHKTVKTFSDAENAFFISIGSYHRKIVNLGWIYSKFGVDIPWGLNFKIIYKSLYNLRGYGLGVDWGGRLRANGDEMLDISRLGDLSVGLTLQDIAGTTIYWNTRRQDRIRPSWLWSAAWEQPLPAWKLQLNLGWAYSSRYGDRSNLGMELVYSHCLSLRLGLKNSGINAGIGLNFKLVNRPIQIDYAFYHHELGLNHRIGAGLEL